MYNRLKKKKIIMVGPHPDGMGGISRVVKTWQAGGLLSKHNIEYIASVSDSSHSKSLFLVISLCRLIVSCASGCRGVYVHTASKNSFYRKCIFLAIAFLCGKKAILHIHPSFFYSFLSSFRGLKKKIFFKLLDRCHSFIVLTREMHSNIKLLFPEKTVNLLPNGINMEGMVNKKAISRENNRLLYLGQYYEGKGVYELVDAMEILMQSRKDIEIEFYGTKEIERLKGYVEEKGLSEKVRINGWLDDDEKLEVLHKSTLLVLPSHTEGIPNVILEAMATKTPIVSTHVGGLTEILTDGENAVIAEARNPRDLSQKISSCLQDHKLRETIATNALQDCRTKYDVNVIREQFARIMETISS
jgi:glycosyltransferase involved in cell wall biosynthesis